MTSRKKKSLFIKEYNYWNLSTFWAEYTCYSREYIALLPSKKDPYPVSNVGSDRI
jgi:hypothetical protein